MSSTAADSIAGVNLPDTELVTATAAELARQHAAQDLDQRPRLVALH